MREIIAAEIHKMREECPLSDSAESAYMCFLELHPKAFYEAGVRQMFFELWHDVVSKPHPPTGWKFEATTLILSLDMKGECPDADGAYAALIAQNPALDAPEMRVEFGKLLDKLNE